VAIGGRLRTRQRTLGGLRPSRRRHADLAVKTTPPAAHSSGDPASGRVSGGRRHLASSFSASQVLISDW
jgi:hypothetical protein